ncbi:MAG: hypothetical protein RR710_09295 [Oscillospiraceae bacterium]
MTTEKGEGIRHFDGKGNLWQLNYGYENTTDAVHGGPYFKTTEGSKGKTVTIDNSIKISKNGMTSYTGLTAIINNFLTISKDKVGIKIGSISVKVGGATSATNENGLNVIFGSGGRVEYRTQWKYFQEAVVEGFKNTCEWMPLPIPGGIPVIQ